MGQATCAQGGFCSNPVVTYTPPAASYVPGNQQVVGSAGYTQGTSTSYEPVESLETYLANQVVTPAANPAGGQPTMTAQQLAATLAQSASEYCAGVASGGPNNPCGGVDQSSVISSLVDGYSSALSAAGVQPGQNLSTLEVSSTAQGVPTSPAGTPAIPAQGYGGSSTVINGAGSVTAPNISPTAPTTNAGGTVSLSSLQALLAGLTQPAATTAAATTSTGNWFTDPTQALISGVPNWAIAGGAALLLVMMMSGGRR